jgi:hypothetical protein
MSNFFTLNWGDLGKGVLMTILMSIGTALLTILEAGDLPTVSQLIAISKIAGIAGLTYLIKNALTNNEGKFLKPDVK